MPRTRAGLLSAYQRHLSLQRDLSQHTVRAYLVDVGDLLSFLGVGEGEGCREVVDDGPTDAFGLETREKERHSWSVVVMGGGVDDGE